MEVAITKMSSKGQIVIPQEMRERVNEGDKFLIIKSKDQYILKRTEDLTDELKADIEFAEKTEAALERISQGKGKEMEFDEFYKHSKQQHHRGAHSDEKVDTHKKIKEEAGNFEDFHKKKKESDKNEDEKEK